MTIEQEAVGGEKVLGGGAFLVSKTDTSGRITYANQTFIELSGYSEQELLSKDHNLVRHPDMPRGVFKLMWDTLKRPEEFVGFVKSKGKDGSAYWAYATIIPSYSEQGEVIGYFSVRRKPKEGAVSAIEEIYRAMLEEEARLSGDAGMRASIALLNNLLAEKGLSYEQYILGLQI
jgi:PAS domain S-box-containing protein